MDGSLPAPPRLDPEERAGLLREAQALALRASELLGRMDRTPGCDRRFTALARTHLAHALGCSVQAIDPHRRPVR